MPGLRQLSAHEVQEVLDHVKTWVERHGNHTPDWHFLDVDTINARKALFAHLTDHVRDAIRTTTVTYFE